MQHTSTMYFIDNLVINGIFFIDLDLPVSLYTLTFKKLQVCPLQINGERWLDHNATVAEHVFLLLSCHSATLL